MNSEATITYLAASISVFVSLFPFCPLWQSRCSCYQHMRHFHRRRQRMQLRGPHVVRIHDISPRLHLSSTVCHRNRVDDRSLIASTISTSTSSRVISKPSFAIEHLCPRNGRALLIHQVLQHVISSGTRQSRGVSAIQLWTMCTDASAANSAQFVDDQHRDISANVCNTNAHDFRHNNAIGFTHLGYCRSPRSCDSTRFMESAHTPSRLVPASLVHLHSGLLTFTKRAFALTCAHTESQCAARTSQLGNRRCRGRNLSPDRPRFGASRVQYSAVWQRSADHKECVDGWISPHELVTCVEAFLPSREKFPLHTLAL